jgi:hypothetical protein
MIVRVQNWTPLLLTILWLLTGCVNINAVTVGRKPDMNALEHALQLGESTREDVRRALGAPFGTGQSIYPWDEQVRETWIYYFERSDIEGMKMKDDHRLVLFVYFAEDKFGGYMWWSSLPEDSRIDAKSPVPRDRAASLHAATTIYPSPQNGTELVP